MILVINDVCHLWNLSPILFVASNEILQRHIYYQQHLSSLMLDKRERQRQREKDREREGGRERERKSGRERERERCPEL